MLQFKTITLCDKEWVDKIVFSEDSPSADYNFGNIYIWDKSFRQLVCPFEGRMMTKPPLGCLRAFRTSALIWAADS